MDQHGRLACPSWQICHQPLTVRISVEIPGDVVQHMQPLPPRISFEELPDDQNKLMSSVKRLVIGTSLMTCFDEEDTYSMQRFDEQPAELGLGHRLGLCRLRLFC